jgi:hypothetical protein
MAPLSLYDMLSCETAVHLMAIVFTLMVMTIVLFAITTHTVMANLLFTFIPTNRVQILGSAERLHKRKLSEKVVKSIKSTVMVTSYVSTIMTIWCRCWCQSKNQRQTIFL